MVGDWYAWTSVEAKESDQVSVKHAAAIKAAMVHTWGGYEKKAWGQDELRPVSGKR